MNARLEEINLTEFTGGFNARRNQFNLAANESPDLLNIDIDPRGGFYTRKGWTRWNATDALGTVADWAPRNTFTHSLSTGSYVVYVANDAQIEYAGSNAVFATLQRAGPTTVVAGADPHLADFAAWGDYLFIVCGSANPTQRRNGTGTPTSINDAVGNYNDDYTTPDAIGSGAFPRCDYVETHGGYVFAAYIKENPNPASPTTPAVQPNRLRWSHPSQPENWATLDYLDIDAGGGKITGLKSFQDHLLIFKTDSVWALYGYDSASWQLVQVSLTVGAPSTTAVAASESAVYFYSTTMNGGVYAYNGQHLIPISTNLNTITDEISPTGYEDIWLGWVGKRLWCSLPWMPDGTWVSGDQTVFVFAPLVGNGAWVIYRPAAGNVTCIVEGSDIYTQNPLVALVVDDAACLMQTEYADAAVDKIVEALTSEAFDAYYTTGWQDAGWLERRKSWRRPRFIMERVTETVAVDLDTYFDYNEGPPMRSHTITVNADDTAFWRETGALEDGGFDWGDGTEWGASGAEGSTIERAVQASVTLSGLGVNRAIQLRFSTNSNYPGKAWGINAITLKYLLRRFTT